MVTNDERRAVVERLRRLQSRQFRNEDKPEIATWEGIGAAVLPDDEWQRIDRFRSRDNRTQAVRSVIAGRLADLIEPSCDRDALLALANNLDSSASMLLKQNDLDHNRKRRGMRRDHAKSLMAASDRIREACGEAVR